MHIVVSAEVVLEAHRDLLRPKAPMSFVAEFLVRWVSSTIHDFAMHAPAALDGEHLADELIDAVARYLLSQEPEPIGSATPTGVLPVTAGLKRPDRQV